MILYIIIDITKTGITVQPQTLSIKYQDVSYVSYTYLIKPMYIFLLLYKLPFFYKMYAHTWTVGTYIHRWFLLGTLMYYLYDIVHFIRISIQQVRICTHKSQTNIIRFPFQVLYIFMWTLLQDCIVSDVHGWYGTVTFRHD